MMRWKWATTKNVLWRYWSRMGWARIGPVRPPQMKTETKPRAKSMEVVRRDLPAIMPEPQTVAIQLRTSAEAGMAMAIEEMANAEPAKGLRPATNMWCPQTRMPMPPMRTMTAIIRR